MIERAMSEIHRWDFEKSVRLTRKNQYTISRAGINNNKSHGRVNSSDRMDAVMREPSSDTCPTRGQAASR